MEDLQILHDGYNIGLNESPKFIAGLKRLNQRFIMELFTQEGSMYYLPYNGCNFLTRIKTARTEFDVMVAFAVCLNQIRRAMRHSEPSALPPEERFGDAKIDNVTITDTGIYIDFVITNQAGEASTITSPIIQLQE